MSSRPDRPRRGLRRGVRDGGSRGGLAGGARLLREPVVPVLVIAGIVDLLSGAPITHGMVLIAAGAALAVDALRRRVVGLARATDGRVRAVHLQASPRWLVAAVLYALLVGSFDRFSWPMSVAVMLPGAAAVVLAWEGPLRERPRPRIDPRGVLPWAAVFLALALWELTNLLLQPTLTEGSYDHPTLSVIMDPILATYPGRAAFLGLWILLGWFLLER